MGCSVSSAVTEGSERGRIVKVQSAATPTAVRPRSVKAPTATALDTPGARRSRRLDAPRPHGSGRRRALDLHDPPALTPLGHRARDAAAHPGHEDLRRQRLADDRAPRGAAHPGAAGPDPPIAPGRDPGHGGSALLLALGIDPIGVARAVIQNYRRGRIVEG